MTREIQPFYIDGYTRLVERRAVSETQAEAIRYLNESLQNRKANSKDQRLATAAVKVINGDLSLEKTQELAESLGLTPEATAELLSFTDAKGRSSDPQLRSSLLTLLNTGNDKEARTLIEDRRTAVADVTDNRQIQHDLEAAQLYTQRARRLSLRASFWTKVADKAPTADIRQLLDNFEADDAGDTLLVNALRTEAARLQRDDSFIAIFTELSKNQQDFDKVANMLRQTDSLTVALGDQRGQDILQTVANTAYQAEINTYFKGLTNRLAIDRQQIAEVVSELQAAPVRAAVAGVDYFGKFQAAKERFVTTAEQLDSFAFEREKTQLQARFYKEPDVERLVDTVLELPEATEEGDQLRQALLDELSLVLTVRRGIDPVRFAMLKEIELKGIRANRQDSQAELDLTATNPERTAEAVKNLVENFQDSIMPLFETLRSTPEGQAMVENYVSGKTGGRDLYVQRIQALEKQRELTDIERSYLESVQLLTVFNAHLVALAKEAPELTSLYLERYFSELSQQTINQLPPDAYFPVAQMGLGPQGVAAAGELARNNPFASKNTFYFDARAMPGGPFGEARGPAWELNSASSAAESTNTLPDVLSVDRAGLSVRSYGSPLVAFPGERKEGFDLRQASINATVDYLPNPDNISTRRYPTNLDISRILQMQTAVLVRNLALKTELVGLEYPNDGQPGDKRLTFNCTMPDGEIVRKTMRTDYFMVPGGLGEPNFGIRLEGSKAEQILEGPNVAEDGFPLLTDTIGGLDVLSKPEGRQVAPKGVLVLVGVGNSTDVLIEYVGRQFESNNPALNGISKIIVIGNGPLSKRPRYAQINDLKARNGQPNFIEFVEARVNDYRETDDGKVEILDEDGQPLQVGYNGSRQVIQANHVIAAAGFRGQLDKIFAEALAEGESIDARRGLDEVNLPSNPGFSIANKLKNDPNVLLLGTASDPDFKNPNKLAQLPGLAREALLRNGVENAVAIGFRAPDSRAAVRLEFENRELEAGASVDTERKPVLVDTTKRVDTPLNTVPVAANQPQTRRNVDADSDTLTALFVSSLPKMQLGRGDQPLKPIDPAANGQFTFNFLSSGSNQELVISSQQSVPAGVLDAVQQAASDPYFQAYAAKALRGRRNNKGIEISLAFRRGKLLFRDPGVESGYGRTYVEAL